MPRAARSPRFYLGVLVTGFLLGGFLHAWLSKVMTTDSPTRTVFTSAARGTFGPVELNLLVIDLKIGPLGVTISPLSVLGVVVAYLVARSLF